MARSEHFDTLEQAKAAFKDCQPCGEYVTIGEPFGNQEGNIRYRLFLVFPDATSIFIGDFVKEHILDMPDRNS